MEDSLKKISRRDLLTLINTQTETTGISSDAEAMNREAVCPHCGGAGYYLEAVPYGHPHFGVLFPCECKQREREDRRRDELIRISNIEAFQEKTFETFSPDVPGVRRAFLRAREYARRPQGWLVLFGNFGVGKTHLAAAIANDLLRHGGHVLFSVVPDLLDHLRSTFGPSSEVEYDKRFADVRDAGVLILDDLGTESATPWAREKLFQIINHRYNYALPTVITSNRKPEDLDPRIFSRMSDRTLCEELIIMDAQDYRRLSVNQRFTQGNQRRRAP